MKGREKGNAQNKERKEIRKKDMRKKSKEKEIKK